MKRFDELRRGLRVWVRFLPVLGEHRRDLALAWSASLGAVGLEILRPWPVQWIFDRALVPVGEPAERPLRVVLFGALALVCIVLARSALQYAAEIQLNVVGHGVTRSLRYRIFAHLTRLSPGFHARHKSGDLLIRLVGDVPMLRTVLVDSSAALVTRAVLVLGTLAVMASVDFVLTVALIGLLPLLLLVVRVFSRRLTVAVRKQRQKEGEMADFMHEALGATSLLQALGRGEHVVRRFARSNRRTARAGLKAARLAARMGGTVETLFGSATALALGLGAWRVLEGQLTPGELLVFLSYVRGLLKPVRSTSKHSEKIARGAACGERVLAILDEKIEVREDAGGIPAPLAPTRLEYRAVAYTYPDGTQALRGFTALLRPGELVGLVGASGAGKSTAVSLALRLFDPQEGALLLDGIDLREYELGSLRERFGLALQEPILFGESVRENLLLGRPDASDEDLWSACALAGADFVRRLPDGLDTGLGSAGAGLSGGERRRLSLARTLLRRTPILLVDEPFAGLDRNTALRVRGALEELAKDGIVLAIAHDVDHLDALDRILFVHEGRVRASGTHAELSARDPEYRRITGQRELVAS